MSNFRWIAWFGLLLSSPVVRAETDQAALLSIFRNLNASRFQVQIDSFKTDLPRMDEAQTLFSAMVLGYQTTKNTEFLDGIITFADGLMRYERRFWYDSKNPSVCKTLQVEGAPVTLSPCQDDLRKRPMAGWGMNNQASGGTYHYFSQNNGLIANGIAEFIKLVQDSPELLANEKYRSAAARYLPILDYIVHLLLPYRWDSPTDEFDGVFLKFLPNFPIANSWSLAGKRVPLNYGASIGQALATLSMIDPTKIGSPTILDKTWYRTGATVLGKYILSKINDNPRRVGTYAWNYMPDDPDGVRVDDIGHSNAVVAFLGKLYEYGYVNGSSPLVSATVISKLQKSFVENIFFDNYGTPDLTGGVDGTSCCGGVGYTKVYWSWLDLVPLLSTREARLLYEDMVALKQRWGAHPLTLAKLIRFESHYRELLQRFPR